MWHTNWFYLYCHCSETSLITKLSHILINYLFLFVLKGNPSSFDSFSPQSQISQHQWSQELKIQSDLCRHDSNKVHLIAWLKVRTRRQKSTVWENRKEHSLSALIALNISKLESRVCVQPWRRQVQEGWILVISCQGSNEQCLQVIPRAATFQGVKCQSVHFPQASQKQHCQGFGCKQ